MEQLDTFLGRHPPFDALSDAERTALVAAGEEISYGAGETVLIEDGIPAGGLWVVVTGSMDIVHEGEAIQVLEPGELFGHPSLLTGMAPAFTIRARESSTCLLFDAPTGRRVLGTEAGAMYVARSLRKRLTRAGHTVHGLHDVGTTPVSAIMRPPTFVEPDMCVRDAAGRLGEAGVSALLIRSAGDGLGIVTDGDLRALLAGGAVDLDVPVSNVARVPAPAVPVGQLAVEAVIDMLAAGAEHVAVLDRDDVCGVLSAADLLGLDASSPIALRHMILSAADLDGLVRSVEHLGQLFGLLMRAGVPPRDLGRVLSLQHDAIVAKLIDFAIWSGEPAPLPWAFLDLGSAARREFTLASDQDNALAYASPLPGEEEAVDGYFERLGREVNDGLARCGIGVDNNGVLAGNKLWRMSKAAWVQTFEECLEEPDESHLIRATVSFDFRPAAGGLGVVAELTDRIRAARSHPQFMRLMARTATGYPVALGFRGQLSTGRGGDPEGKLDIKRTGVIPLVNLVRFHALAHGVTISPTLDRIEAVASSGGFEPDEADALSEAFEVIMRLRFDHHAHLISAGAAPDNLIDPGALTPIARTELREAMAVVRRAQKRIGAWSPPAR
jgi:CBS domain-containing protein